MHVVYMYIRILCSHHYTNIIPWIEYVCTQMMEVLRINWLLTISKLSMVILSGLDFNLITMYVAENKQTNKQTNK